MIRKNRGAVDPFSLGIILALAGTFAVSTTHEEKQSDSQQQTTAQVSEDKQQAVATNVAMSEENLDW